MAFADCYSLETLALPPALKRIDGHAFARSGLTELVIPPAVVQAGEGAFKDCSHLEKLRVPEAWRGTDKLAAAQVPAGCEIIYYKTEPKTVWRFYSKKYKGHFFTIGEKEKNDLIAKNPNWAYEKIAFYALALAGKSAKAGKGMEAAGLEELEGPAQPGGGEAELGDGEGAVSQAGRLRPGTEVAVTTCDGADGSAVCDGDEATGWSPETADGSWVVLSFADVRKVGDVEVVGVNLPEGTRILLSENADEWTEEVPGTARYVWVAFPSGETRPVVRGIRVAEE
jgi:hypothetical protein